MSQQPAFSAYGAVDLAALAARSQPPAAPAPGAAGAPAPSGLVLDVTEATFEAEVINRSMTVPVVIDLWAEWCGPCKTLSPILERLAAEYAGRWVLAKVDVDAEQRIAAAFQVQSIPSIVAVVKGQPLPLFQGALPEAQVRQYIEELLKFAATNGVTGTLAADGQPGAVAQPVEAEPPSDPRYDRAYDAIERGDYAAAADAYREVLAQAPADPDAKAGLLQVELLQRTEGVDPGKVIASADAAPEDVDAQTAAADVELLGGEPESAFSRLVALVARSAGEDRDRARTHLVGLFELLGPEDARVAKARRALAQALF